MKPPKHINGCITFPGSSGDPSYRSPRPNLTKEERGVYALLKEWPEGYGPCKGSDLIPILDSLVQKGFLKKSVTTKSVCMWYELV